MGEPHLGKRRGSSLLSVTQDSLTPWKETETEDGRHS